MSPKSVDRRDAPNAGGGRAKGGMGLAIASPRRAVSGSWRAGWLAVLSLALLVVGALATTPARAHLHPPSAPSSSMPVTPATVHDATPACPMAKACAGEECLVPCLNHCLGVGTPITGAAPSASARVAARLAGWVKALPGRDPPPEQRPPMPDAGARSARDRA